MDKTKVLKRSLRVGMTLAIAYLWAHLYLRAGPLDPAQSFLGYLATVVPIAMFAGAGLLVALSRGYIARSSQRHLAWIVAFVFLTTLASASRGDQRTLLSAGLLGLVLAWIAATRPDVRVETLNTLMLASLIGGALAYLTGLSPYGVIPGQYHEGEDRGIEWRVSLFPLIPESGYLAALAMVFNRLHGRGAWRWLCMSLAAYFLLLSGVRSALLAWLLCEAYVQVHRRTTMHQQRLRMLAVLALLVLFVIGVMGSSVLLLLPGLANSPVSSWLFREAATDLSSESLEQSVYRVWLWIQHLELFFSSPLLGVGTYNFGALVGSMVEGAADTGSESFLTFWLSRVGLCFLPFIALLIGLLRSAVRQASPLQTCAFIVFMVAALAYGSILVPYNLIFVLLFAVMMSADSSVTPSRVGRIVPTPISATPLHGELDAR
jgi:hypothetical protein